MSGMGKRFRACTNEQITRGTSIDIRADQICQSLVDRWNDIPRCNMRGMLVPLCYTLGWSPMQEYDGEGGFGNSDHHLPWMWVYNSLVDTWDFVAPAADVFLNPWRHKGHRAQDICSEDYNLSSARQWAWTSSFASGYPFIIDSITWWLTTDHTGVYQNPFQWETANTYPPNDQWDYVSDWNIVLMCDHPFSLEHRNHNALAASLWERRADCTFFASDGLVGPAQDMQPNFGRLPFAGVVARMRNLGISIPAGARWRLGVFIPQYDVTEGYDSPWHGTGAIAQDEDRHFHFQRYSINVWGLQEVV